MASKTLSGVSEWRANWPLLVCSMLGISTPMIAPYALGQLLLPLEQEFGWSRTQSSIGLSVSMVLGFLAAPLVGRLVDKTNARWLVLSGLVLLGLTVAGFSLATNNLVVWVGLWCLYAIASALAGPVVWLAVISAVFERHRSIAIAVALSGTAIGTGFGPPMTRLLLDAYGWRGTFQMLALVWVAPALLVAAFFFFDRRARASRATHNRQDTGPKQKQLRSVFLSPTFIKLAIAIAATSTASAAYSIHLVPALAEKGLNLDEAAAIAGMAGLSAIPGKLAVGSLLDRYGTARVALLVEALLAAACVLFAIKVEGIAIAMTASVVFGFTAGANLALSAVITAKLFSTSVFGAVYGSLMSISALGAAFGPLTASAVYDANGSYAPIFWAGIGIAALAAVLLANLTPVPLQGGTRRVLSN